MKVRSIKTSVNVPETLTFTRIDDFENFLRSKYVPNEDISKLSKKLSYSAKIKTIIHDFHMYDITKQQAEMIKQLSQATKVTSAHGPIPPPPMAEIAYQRIALRNSTIIKVKKEGKNMVATATVITVKAAVDATERIETREVQQTAKGMKINVITERNVRGLTGEELEKINNAIDDKARPFIRKYSV